MDERRNIEAEEWAQIQAEFSNFTKAPPSSQPLLGLFEQIELAVRAYSNWVEVNREPLIRFLKAVHDVAAKVGNFIVKMDEASQRFALLLGEVERLADCGWTLPTELTISELIEFLQLPDGEAASAFLIQRHDLLDPDWSHVEARLCNDNHLGLFETVLPQCFRAIRQGDYAVAVPHLVAMLERVIQTLNPESLHASTNVLKTLHATGLIAEKAQEDLFCGALWLSLLTVVKPIWRNLSLNVPDSAGLSRHGVQHGTIEAPNTKTEIVRLLNTLETALALHEVLREIQEFSISGRKGATKMQPVYALLGANFFLPRGKHQRATDS